jgi:RNA polymerase sigma factor (TIGR02999 family)
MSPARVSAVEDIPTVPETPSDDITGLLHAIAGGDRGAEDQLIPLVYGELRRIAAGQMRYEGRAHTLQATALVHEAYLRLAKPGAGGWQNRAHFFAVAARVMRRLLVDAARARNADKRGGGAIAVPDGLDFIAVEAGDPEEMIAIDRALTRLAEMDARQARIVELRFFAGMTVEEIAELLGISSRTVKREWRMARAWLFGELGGGELPPDA